VFPLRLPHADDDDTFRRCVERRRAKTRILLKPLSKKIHQAYDSYRSVNGNPRLLTPLVCDEQTKSALHKNFHLLNTGKPLATVRQLLMRQLRLAEADSVEYDDQLCPMCGGDVLSDLDHYLPRSVYPEYSVLSANLVPVCSKCNRLKGDCVGDTMGGRFLHAYFDLLPPEPVLVTRVRVAGAVTIAFELQKPASMKSDLFQAVQFHFNHLGLALAFLRVGVTEMHLRRGSLTTMFRKAKMQGVRDYLEMEADSAAAERGENYWRTALLRGLCACEAFCTGGFKLLRSPSQPATPG